MGKLSQSEYYASLRPKVKEYDPNDPHFDPFHPPEGTPIEVLEAFWGEEEDNDN